MIKEFGTKERGLGESCEYGGQESPVNCPHGKRKGCAGHGGQEGDVGAIPLGLTHKCLPTKRKGSGCLEGMKWAPHLNV